MIQMHQHAFPSSVLTDETALGLQFFHDAAKHEGARGNDFFTARFQAGYPDSVCYTGDALGLRMEPRLPGPDCWIPD